MKISREQIDKNVRVMRWKIGRADPDVIQQLTCCLVRSVLLRLCVGCEKCKPHIGCNPVHSGRRGDAGRRHGSERDDRVRTREGDE